MVSYFNQVPIYYSIIGKGPSLVLLHGFLLSATIWDELAPKLSKKNKVIIIDLPGHGESGCLAKVHTMELMAEVINFILEKNNIKQISPLGEKFDYNFHQAMFEIPTNDCDPGLIVEVSQNGYLLYDRLVRPAMVGISKKIEEKKDNQEKGSDSFEK